jgi:tripartite ATP-independent transporter DctM subunit
VVQLVLPLFALCFTLHAAANLVEDLACGPAPPSPASTSATPRKPSTEPARTDTMTTGLFFLAVMLLGVPIGVCLCLAGIVYIFATDATVLFQSFPRRCSAADSYGLIAIPLFILIGEIMGSGGITRHLVDLAMGFVGAVRGGLAYVNVLANMMLASIIGSATAQVAIMSKIMVPEMEKQGYDKTFAVLAVTVYGGMLGPIIPPSVMFVVYSVLAQVAVGDMLMAGILPGILLTVLFFIVIACMGLVYNYPRSEKKTLRERARTIALASPTLLIPIVIVGSILAGIANPTESAAVGAVVSALVGRFVTRTAPSCRRSCCARPCTRPSCCSWSRRPPCSPGC